MMIALAEDLVRNTYELKGEATCLSRMFLEHAYILNEEDDPGIEDDDQLVCLSFTKKELIQIATMLMQLASKVGGEKPS